MAKFCTYCGAQVRDNVKFCVSCGQAQSVALPVQPPVQQPKAAPSQAQQIPQSQYMKPPQYQQQYVQPPIYPPAPAKKSKIPFIIAGEARLCVIVLVAILVITKGLGFFGGDLNLIGTSQTDRPTANTIGQADKPTATMQKSIETSKIDSKLVGPEWYHNMNIGLSQIILVFKSNGEFTQKVHKTGTSYDGNSGAYEFGETYEGTYSASNGKITFTYTSAKREEGNNTGWKTIATPAVKTLSYSFRVEDQGIWNKTYLDIHGALPPFTVPITGGDKTTFQDPYENYTGDKNSQENKTVSWPSDLMSSVPEYGDKGRIIEVKTPSSGYGGQKSNNVNIIIGDTTSEAFSEYCNKVLQAGWVLNSLWTEEELKSGKGGSLKKEGYDFTLELSQQNDGNYSIYKRW
jgi:hypothetical protein